MGVGFSKNASQTIGQWTPAALSLGFGLWGSARAATASTLAAEGSNLAAPTRYALQNTQLLEALQFQGVRSLGSWDRLSLWFTPSVVWPRMKLLFSELLSWRGVPQFVYQGEVADARVLLARLTAMTNREVGLLRLGDNGPLVIRLGRSGSRLSMDGATSVLAHTHPDGNLMLSVDWLRQKGISGLASDTGRLRELGQNSTWLIGPRGDIIRWTSPGRTWQADDLFFEVLKWLGK